MKCLVSSQSMNHNTSLKYLLVLNSSGSFLQMALILAYYYQGTIMCWYLSINFSLNK